MHLCPCPLCRDTQRTNERTRAMNDLLSRPAKDFAKGRSLKERSGGRLELRCFLKMRNRELQLSQPVCGIVNYESENNSFSDSFSIIIPDKLQRNCNHDSSGIEINTALRGMIHRAFDNSSSPLLGDSSFNLHCFMARRQI